MISAFGVEHTVSKGLPSALRAKGKLIPLNKYTRNRMDAHRYGRDAAAFMNAGKKSDIPALQFGTFASMREGTLARAASRKALK